MAKKKNLHAVELGRLGGRKKGPAKKRGDSQFYRDLANKRWKRAAK